MTAVLINRFTVPEGTDDAFRTLYLEVNAFMRAQPGYLGNTMVRAIDPQTPQRYVNIARWSSAPEFGAAHGDAFKAMISTPMWQEFGIQPILYDVLLDVDVRSGADQSWIEESV
jgi:heme-degrading monooxygenase HmoA